MCLRIFNDAVFKNFFCLTIIKSSGVHLLFTNEMRMALICRVFGSALHFQLSLHDPVLYNFIFPFPEWAKNCNPQRVLKCAHPISADRFVRSHGQLLSDYSDEILASDMSTRFAVFTRSYPATDCEVSVVGKWYLWGLRIRKCSAEIEQQVVLVVGYSYFYIEPGGPHNAVQWTDFNWCKLHTATACHAESLSVLSRTVK